LKGHDFSRAAYNDLFTSALAAEGWFGGIKTFHQGQKPKTFGVNLRHD